MRTLLLAVILLVLSVELGVERPPLRSPDPPHRLHAIPVPRLGLRVSTVEASEIGEGMRFMGHPRARFPLSVYARPAPDAALDVAVRAAVRDWNTVFEATLGVPAWTWTEREEVADVVLRFASGGPPGLMGQTRVDADAGGVVRLPVRIDLAEPAARGQTSAATVLFQVAAHELGHALGLPHAVDPASLMCCVRGAVNLQDPATRARYVEARRRPDVRSVTDQLEAHYRRFW